MVEGTGFDNLGDSDGDFGFPYYHRSHFPVCGELPVVMVGGSAAAIDSLVDFSWCECGLSVGATHVHGIPV